MKNYNKEDVVFFIRTKNSTKFLEGYTYQGKTYQIRKTELKDKVPVVHLNKEYIYQVDRLTGSLQETDTVQYCSKEVKEWILDHILMPATAIPFPEDINVNNIPSFVQPKNVIEEIKPAVTLEELKSLIKGLNKDLLYQYCKQAYNAGYKSGYERAKEVDFEDWFHLNIRK